MENCGEAGDDDQGGSGWLQVKKKHRSSSKFSLQAWVGGISGKQPSNFLHSQPSVDRKSANSHRNRSGKPSKARGSFSVHCQGRPGHSTSVSNEDEKGVHYLDKRVVSQGYEQSKSSVSGYVNVTNSDKKSGDVQELPQNDNPDVLPKIKWGDLDEGVLVLHQENTVGSEIKFGDIVSDKLFPTPSCVENEGNQLVAKSIDTDHVPHQMPSLSPTKEILEENCQEGNEVSSEDVKEKIAVEKIVDQIGGDVSHSSGENMLAAANQEAWTIVELPACEAVDQDSERPAINVGLGTVVISEDPESPPSERGGCETSGESTLAASSEAQNMGAISADDERESKERFRQRLWCFLFENLNRAVDELYLLCELECDLEQMKEAILVLEEAASDFKELNSRVEEFETVKKSSAQLNDGAPVTMKSDHRRPHALSWEVRRMTTSPHRAEILSSSLEAFRKIQQERANIRATNDAEKPGPDCSARRNRTNDIREKRAEKTDGGPTSKESAVKLRKQSGVPDLTRGNSSGERRNADSARSNKVNSVQSSRLPPQNSSTSHMGSSSVPIKESSNAGKSKKEQVGSSSEAEKTLYKKDKSSESMVERNPKCLDHLKKQIPLPEKEKEKKNGGSWKSMDAWKEKRNWEDILASPFRVSSRFSYSPGMGRRSAERARTLHDKLLSPEKKKKTALDLKKEAEEKHARAMRIRSELENERVQKLQRTSEKLNRVNEWQAVRSLKLREGMHARHQRSESRHEAFLAQVVRRAGDESSKVNEVRFITSLNEENKKFILRQKLHDSELRRAEKLQVMKTKQKEDMAREEAVLERKKLIEAEKLQRLAETQRKKEEAQVRREEERKASSAAREAKAQEQLRRKEVRAKAQQEEAELMAQKLAERLGESEQRRKFYLEQIRERASMDFRDQSSPLFRRSLNKEGQGRSTPPSNGEDEYSGGSTLPTGNVALQHSLKRRVKRIRQRLMALKCEFTEPPAENVGIGYKTAVGTARAKIGRWLQELQRLRQARKEGAASIGLITAEMIKFLDGKDPELHASRQAGLLDFIASTLPASHTSKPEACQVTIYLLRLLRVVLSVPPNRSYFLAQNLLPPIIPMLAAALENYIKIAASANVPGATNSLSCKTSLENLDSISEVLDGFLWTVATIIGHVSSEERQLQMQDGLRELVVAYQVIHRLRELFALYDRPQIEGSPFPSSILLSINLLAVLSSRSRNISSINWEAFPVEAEAGNSFNADYRPPLSAINGSIVLPLPDVPEDRPLDESVTSEKDSACIEFISAKIDVAEIKDGSHGIVVDEKDEKIAVDNCEEYKNENKLKQPIPFLLSVISETGLVCLPSLLTAVLLQANNRLSSEQASYVLPSNFEEVATGVLKVFNNLALIDITFMQRMLARPDLKMEFFHLMSFLISHCTTKWRVASDQIGLLLLESLLLLGYFSLFHRENQAVLRWGKSPTILHKVCDLPFVFFSDPELMPVLAGTLVASCFGCEQNKGVIQQELSTEMLLSLIKSCKNGLPSLQSSSALDTDYSSESNQLGPESKKIHGDLSLKSTRYNIRTGRISAGKSVSFGNSVRTCKIRSQKDGKAMKIVEESMKQNQSGSETFSTLMLHSRFPGSFIDRAEQFFSAEITCSE